MCCIGAAANLSCAAVLYSKRRLCIRGWGLRSQTLLIAVQPGLPGHQSLALGLVLAPAGLSKSLGRIVGG